MTLLVYLIRFFYTKETPDPMEFLEWYFYSPKMRTIWIIFFSFIIGFFLSAIISQDTTREQQLVFTSLITFFGIMLFYFIRINILNTFIIKKVTIKEVPKFPSLLLNPCEMIYIFQRDDGILKFGRTKDLQTRLNFHKEDYKADFKILNSWIVFDSEKFERLALDITKKYSFVENNRKELRKMTNEELSNFVLFLSNEIQKDFIERIQNGLTK